MMTQASKVIGDQLTSAKLNEAFEYAADSGALTWRKPAGRCGRIGAGSEAGTRRKDGYLLVGIGGKKYLAHRLIWMMVYGKFPDGQIDHIDGDPTNNRLSNLRDVAPEINSQNQRRARGTTASGFLGVSKMRDKWRATIKAGGTRSYLGVFSTPEDAHAVYVEAKRRLHPGGTI